MSIVAALLVLCSAAGADGSSVNPPLVERTIEFNCDGKPAERAYVVEAVPDQINYTIPSEGPCRLTEKGMYVIYAFPLEQAKTARIELRCGNRFQFMVSGDRNDWKPLLREETEAAGLNNLAWRTADLTPFLGGDTLYLKLDYSLPDKVGFGGALFKLKLTYQQTDLTVPLASVGRASVAPVIDHTLDDAVWQTAQTLQPFWTLKSRQPGRQETVARVAWDADALYVAVDCTEKNPDSIVSLAKERDGEVYRDPAIEVFLQPPGKTDYYHFAVNSIGTQYDEIGRSGPQDWNPEWTSSAGTTDHGWCAELRIPFGSLSVAAPNSGDTWRMNIGRAGVSNGEIACWSPVLKDFHCPERFGVVRFVDQAPSGLRPAWTNGAMPISGDITPWQDGCTLRLSEFPEKGNASRRPVAVADRRFTVEEALFDVGRGMMALSLCDNGGNVLSRVAAPYEVLAPKPPRLVVQLKQPYYTDEPFVEARATLNAPDAAKLDVQLRRDGSVVAERNVGTVTGDQLIQFSTADLAEGDYTLVFTLVDKDGKPVGGEERVVHRLSPKVTPSKVEIRDDGVCFVNGKPFFPVIFHLAGGGETVARAANTVLGGGEDPKACADLLDSAQAFGMMAMPHLCNLLRGKNDWDGFRATVSRNKNHPALLSWYIADEPEGSGDTPDLLAKARDIIREIDPNHPVTVLNNTPSVFGAYAAVADIHMADPYPIPNSPITMVSEWTDICRKAAGPAKPTWMCLQAFDLALYGDKNGRWPTAEELRCMLYLSLTHGSKGIAWWCYNHARDGGCWDTYESLYKELNTLAPYLTSMDKVAGLAVAAEDKRLHVSVHPHGNQYLVLVANPGEAVKSKIAVSGVHATKATPLFGGDPLPVTDGSVEVSVEALGREAIIFE